MDRQDLIEKVLEQIELDVHNNDFMALEELLDNMSDEFLKGYLPEDRG